MTPPKPTWGTACLDWESRIVAGKSLIPFAPLFPDEAQRGLEVFKSLRITDVPGKPTMGEVGRDWIFDFVAAIFGSYDPDAARQAIREYFLLVSKKNSKSSTAAAVMMTALILNPRHSAEFVILAPTKEIAGNSFAPAAEMAKEVNAELEAEGESPLFRVYLREKRVLHLGTNAELKVIAADSDTVGGTKATVVLVDELWLFGKKSDAMSMFREATGGLTARPEGFVVFLSTMSDQPPAGEFKAKLDYARKVRDGEIDDPQFLPVIYEFPRAMVKAGTHANVENFYITNPNLGASVDEDYLRREYGKAEAAGKESLIDFLAKHGNVEIGMSLRSDRWPGADHWQEAADDELTLDELLALSEVVCIGIDGGGLDDLLSLAVIGRDAETRDWLHWSKSWCDHGALERRKSEAARYKDFERVGDLDIVGGLPDDIGGLMQVVSSIDGSGKLHCVGVDPIGISEIIEKLAEIEITQEDGRVVGIPQGYKLAGAIWTVERKLADGSFFHCAQPLMAWAVGNAKVEQRGNAVLVTKQAAGKAKIDPLIATFNAAALMATNPPAPFVSVYDRMAKENANA